MSDPIEQLFRATFNEDATRAPQVQGLAASARQRSISRRRRSVAGVGSLVVAVVAGATALATGLVPGSARDSASVLPALPTTTLAAPAWSGCDFGTVQPNSADPGSAPPVKPLDLAFHPVALVKCEVDFVTGDDGSVVRTGFERRTDDPADVAVITTGLHLPDLRYVKGTACLTYGQLAPSFVLLDAHGNVARARLPVDGCGHFRSEVWDKYRAVHTQVVLSRPLDVVTTAAAAKAGCAQRAERTKYLMELAPERGGRLVPETFTGDQIASVCLYTRPSADPTQPEAEFAGGIRLGASARLGLSAAIKASTPENAGCNIEAARFVLISNDRDSAAVELDGCRRAIVTVSEGADVRILRLRASPELLRHLNATPSSTPAPQPGVQAEVDAAAAKLLADNPQEYTPATEPLRRKNIHIWVVGPTAAGRGLLVGGAGQEANGTLKALKPQDHKIIKDLVQPLTPLPVTVVSRGPGRG